MKQFLQQYTYATLVWLVLFIVDFGIELFQIVNETRVTMMGLVIKNVDTPEVLYNLFSIHSRLYYIYVVFICLWLTCYAFFYKKKG